MSPQHRTRRSVALTWARPASSRWELQVDALIFIPPPVGVHGATNSGRLTLAGSRQTDQQLRVQTNPRPPSFLGGLFSEACFISFPGNGSPEVSLRTVRVWSRRGKNAAGRRFKWREAGINAAESQKFQKVFNSCRLNTNSAALLTHVSPALGSVPKY